MYFKNKNFIRGPSFKSTQQFLKVLKKFAELITSYLLTADYKKKSYYEKRWILLKKKQNLKYQSFFQNDQNLS